jgi:CheY-like chemotaxis protein
VTDRVALVRPLFSVSSVMAHSPDPDLEFDVPPDAAGRLTVLLGDDRDAAEPWHQTAVGVLGAQGVQTVTARTGGEVMRLIEAGVRGGGPRIHVAVLEHRMPDMTGLQVIRRLREEVARHFDHSASEAIPPAILLAPPADRAGTTGVATNFMQEALGARCFSVLPHPVQIDLLLDTLARAVKRHYAGRWPGSSPDIIKED